MICAAIQRARARLQGWLLALGLLFPTALGAQAGQMDVSLWRLAGMPNGPGEALLQALAAWDTTALSNLLAKHPELTDEPLEVTRTGWGDAVFVGSALELAVAAEFPDDRIAWLLDHGFSADGLELHPSKRAPLIWAVDNCNPAVVDLLLMHGADPNCRDVNDNLPLSVALRSIYETYRGPHKVQFLVMRLLLEHGADPNRPAPLYYPGMRKEPMSADILQLCINHYGFMLPPQEDATAVARYAYAGLAKRPAGLELTTVVLLAMVLTAVARYLHRRFRPSPLQQSAAADAFQKKSLNAAAFDDRHPKQIPAQAVEEHLQRAARVRALRWYTIMPIAVGVATIAFAFDDPFLEKGDPWGLIQLSAWVFGGCYLATWIPWRSLQTAGWLATGLFAVFFGIPQPAFSGYLVGYSLQAHTLQSMFYLCAGLMAVEAVLAAVLFWLHVRLVWFQARVWFRAWRNRRALQPNTETTGVESDGAWDEHKG